jgi:hypothetical protein
MQHSQSDVALGTKNGPWHAVKHAESLKKRSNTAQNLQFYGALSCIQLCVLWTTGLTCGLWIFVGSTM